MANTTKRPVIDEPPGFSEAWDRLTAGSLPKFTGRKQAYAEFFRAGLNMRSNWIEPKPIVTRKIPAAGSLEAWPFQIPHDHERQEVTGLSIPETP